MVSLVPPPLPPPPDVFAAGLRCRITIEPYAAVDCPRCDSTGAVRADSELVFRRGELQQCEACRGEGVRHCEAAPLECCAQIERMMRSGEAEIAICNHPRCLGYALMFVMDGAMRAHAATLRTLKESLARMSK